jgi:AraC-like DNA-binding protein
MDQAEPAGKTVASSAKIWICQSGTDILTRLESKRADQRMQTTTVSTDFVRLVRDRATGVEAIQASFSGHAYDLHRHDDWLVGVTDRGLQDFSCRGIRHRSTTGRVILIEPQEHHDGDAGSREGFTYSMLYLPQGWLRAALGVARDDGLGFHATLTDDLRLAAAIRIACATLHARTDRLTRDAALDAVLISLRAHLDLRGASARQGRAPAIARRARERLLDDLTKELSSDELALQAGAADRFQLARAFRASYGTSPHSYLVQMRLLEARRLLARGDPPAAVAASCGFADQSHLGRWFRRGFGLTPAAYRKCCTGVPDIPESTGLNTPLHAGGIER